MNNDNCLKFVEMYNHGDITLHEAVKMVNKHGDRIIKEMLSQGSKTEYT